MKQVKIVTILGARPQFVKAAMVSKALLSFPNAEEVLVHTGQHFEYNMSDIFFEELTIPKPHYNLNIHSCSHASMTGQMMEKTERILEEEKPDWVLVYGDTNSTLAGALTACKMHIKVAHVEAGLRSYNKFMPEEINRVVTDRVSDLLFCPTGNAVENLQKEGFELSGTTIIRTGDVMLDAVVFFKKHSLKPAHDLPANFSLCTLHRAENTDCDEKLEHLLYALSEIAKTHPIVFPIHPRTRLKLEKTGFSFSNSPIHFIPPVGYLEMLWLLEHANIVLTDSGGLQKEAYFFNKFCITLREETEWRELVSEGANFLAGSSPEKIIHYFEQCEKKSFKNIPKNLYGDGNAAKVIAKTIVDYSLYS